MLKMMLPYMVKSFFLNCFHIWRTNASNDNSYMASFSDIGYGLDLRRFDILFTGGVRMNEINAFSCCYYYFTVVVAYMTIVYTKNVS